MPRTYDPARTCLPLRDWPQADQRLWVDAFVNRDPEDETRGRQAAWRAKTAANYRNGYGRWLNFLQRSGADLTGTPAERVTPESVKTYRQELSGQGVIAQSCSNRISQLLSVLLVFAPYEDWDWLRRRARRANSIADAERQQKPVSLLAGDILEKALIALDRGVPSGPDWRLEGAVAYRNWLMVAALCLMPLRRRNFAEISIKRHLRRVGDIWTIGIPAAESKTDRPIDMPVPKVLHRHFEYYFENVRPALLAGRKSDRLWISFHHTAITDHSVYICLTNFTRKMFGEAINPHRFRHIGATSTVIAAPELLEAARAFLGHSDSQTTKDFYILGQSLTASRRQGQVVAKLRRRISGPEIIAFGPSAISAPVPDVTPELSNTSRDRTIVAYGAPSK